MPESIPLTAESVADLPHPDDGTNEIAPDLAYRRLAMVNVVFFGLPGCGDGNWILIDTGVAGMAKRIKSAAQERFGGSGKPAAIILTHGHSDHVGSAEKLLEEWNVPVYSHPAERCFLDGTQSYPAPDTSVGVASCQSWPHFFRGDQSISRTGFYPCRWMEACRECRDGAGCTRQDTRRDVYKRQLF